jgi:hypothetical protein
LPGHGLNGTISRTLGDLTNLANIKFNRNHLTGRVPDSLTNLTSLKELDLSMNALSGPLPNFKPTVKVDVDGNLNFNSTALDTPPNGDAHQLTTPSSMPGHPVTPSASQGSEKKHSSVVVLATTIPVALGVVALISVFFRRKRAPMLPQAASVVIHPRDSSDPRSLCSPMAATTACLKAIRIAAAAAVCLMKSRCWRYRISGLLLRNQVDRYLV